MKTYIVTPVHGGQPYELSAETASYDSQTGAVEFKDADGNLLARELNVSFREKQQSAPTE